MIKLGDDVISEYPTGKVNVANSINQKTGGNIILIPKGSGLGNLKNIIG